MNFLLYINIEYICICQRGYIYVPNPLKVYCLPSPLTTVTSLKTASSAGFSVRIMKYLSQSLSSLVSQDTVMFLVPAVAVMFNGN